MTGRQIVVETGLDERAGAVLVDGKVVPRTRHARTRFVEAVPMPVEAVPGDRWTPPLVAAKLQRMASLFRRDRVRGLWPQGYRSNLPEPLLDRSSDYARAVTVPRPGLVNAELDYATEVFGIVLKLWPGDEDAPSIVWCIANQMDYSDAAEEMNAATWRRKRDWTARNIRYHWAENIAPRLVGLFTKLQLRIDPEDVARAMKRSFHRNI